MPYWSPIGAHNACDSWQSNKTLAHTRNCKHSMLTSPSNKIVRLCKNCTNQGRRVPQKKQIDCHDPNLQAHGACKSWKRRQNVRPWGKPARAPRHAKSQDPTGTFSQKYHPIMSVATEETNFSSEWSILKNSPARCKTRKIPCFWNQEWQTPVNKHFKWLWLLVRARLFVVCSALRFRIVVCVCWQIVSGWGYRCVCGCGCVCAVCFFRRLMVAISWSSRIETRLQLS